MKSNTKPNDWQNHEGEWKNLRKGDLDFEPTNDELKAIKPIVDVLSDWEEPLLAPPPLIKEKIDLQIGNQPKSNRKFIYLISTLGSVAAALIAILFLYNPLAEKSSTTTKDVSLNSPVTNENATQLSSSESSGATMQAESNEHTTITKADEPKSVISIIESNDVSNPNDEPIEQIKEEKIVAAPTNNVTQDYSLSEVQTTRTMSSSPTVRVDAEELNAKALKKETKTAEKASSTRVSLSDIAGWDKMIVTIY